MIVGIPAIYYTVGQYRPAPGVKLFGAMMAQVGQTPARTAFSIAGTFALIFGAGLFFFLVSTILLVGGDGSAPGVTHLSVAIMHFSARVLGTPEVSGVVSAVWLWSSVVFATVFVSALLFRMVVPAANKTNFGYGGYVFLAAFVLGIWNLHQVKVQTNDRDKEQELVLDLVRNNPAVIQKVGVIDSIHAATWQEINGRIVRYEIYVRGKRDTSFHDLYAVVEVSRGSGKPEYVLRCTNSKIGYFGPKENPCKGDAE